MRWPCAISVEIDRAPCDALADLRRALAAESLGVLVEVDLSGSEAGRLPPGPASALRHWLGLVSADVMSTVGEADPEALALLPCGCGVLSAGDHGTRIVLQDPRLIAMASDDVAVRAACERLRASLCRVADRLAETVA